MEKFIYSCLFSTFFIATTFSNETRLFDGYLALVEVVSVEQLDPSKAEGHVIKTGLVHNPIGKIIEVFEGPIDLVGTSFPLTPPPYITAEPNTLTHSHLSFDGVVPEKNLPIGGRAVLTLHHRKDFNPDQSNHNPYNFPDQSVFFMLHGSGFALDKTWPELFQRRLAWAEAIKRYNAFETEKERVVFLKNALRSENSLLAVSAVHLFKRFYPREALDHFDDIILAPGVSIYARLAIDHELCLTRGQAWVEGKQKELDQALENETLDVPEAKEILGFRRQMIDNKSWFGGREERE